MRKIFIIAIALLVNCCHDITPVYSQSNITAFTTLQKQGNETLKAFLDKFLKYSNDHDIEEFGKLYDFNYISGDGLKKDQLLSMTKETWASYPDIKYSSQVREIRINNNLATVESVDKAVGTTAQKSEITKDLGVLCSETHNILYLQRFGKNWKIISDKVFYEKTVIKYGSAKNLKIDFWAPEQVNYGEAYTASVQTQIPEGMYALGSIVREPIVYPQVKSEEVFRQVQPESGLLERVMKANTTNNNELAIASLGYTEITDDIYANPEMKMTGLAVLLSRVNVIPKNQFTPTEEKQRVYSDTEPDSMIETEENQE